MICAALADGTSRLTGVLDSEDTQVMMEAWKQLGVSLLHDRESNTVQIKGCGGRIRVSDAELHLANSGTSIRFLTAALAACHGTYRLDGIARMRERPIRDLLSALRTLGATVESVNDFSPDCPPIVLHAQGLRGGIAQVAGGISSQFLSGVMLAAPMAEQDVVLSVEGKLVSVPYIQMTIEVMRSFGAEVAGRVDSQIEISSAKKYRGVNYAIEPDASAASYFWAAAAICGGKATVHGLSRNSLQGDVRFCDVLSKMGCSVVYSEDRITVSSDSILRGVEMDMADISDTVQTLAAVALFAEGPTRIRGVAHNRVKETDRISDLARELVRLGARVEEYPDGLDIYPAPDVLPARIETYGDHRMAMSLALVGLRSEGVEILDPDCTSKTYPGFWDDLAAFSGCRTEWID